MKKWLLKLERQVINFFKGYAEELRKSNYVGQLEAEVLYLRDHNKALSKQLSAQANLLQIKEGIINNYAEMERHLQAQLAQHLAKKGADTEDAIIVSEEPESPCPNCGEGEMKHIITNPGGTQLFECTKCGHEERGHFFIK